ncbi:metal ABC transporter substrate-binding protein [Azospirillum melinis]|uniref:Lipoprotein n=1 Tax=Azospirillum melinis TaxID=328839 RepID=A0ABX2KHA3_9PROT|nr:MetQ/NlpA family lipoprotein [Azospirillum melinis]MBP2305862.1 D-methionine transport system substrate-binding protein [Azospirillum melinis]NUA99153.1 metal ABC transporter substrate-binding protein [Azospirillum melinis]
MTGRLFGRIARALSIGAAFGAVFAATTGWAADPVHLKVGIRGGISEPIWEIVARVAKPRGLEIEPVVMAGSLSPNEALNTGDLQANAFQHIPFLRDQIAQRGYKLAVVGNTYLSPIAFYSKTYKSLKDLPNGARVGVPDDPSNESRALIVLRDEGLLSLRDGFDAYNQTATLADIKENPRKLQIVEVKSVVLARSYQDLDAAAIISSFGSQVGLNAARDGIAQEKRDNNPNVNIIVVREQDKDAPWVKPLVESFQSPEVRAHIEKELAGILIPAF